MGLFCSKEKQTANVSPVNVNNDDAPKNNGDVAKKTTEIDADRANTPQPTNEEEAASPRPADGDEPVVVPNEEPFERAHQSLTNTPAVNSYDDNTFNSTRIAFVGALESGKTTICQQIKVYCKERPHEIELQHRPGYINDSLFINMDRLLNLMKTLNIKFGDPENEKYVDVVQANLADRRGRPLLSHEVDALAILWEDPGIQEAYDHRSEINMNDSVRYFFNSIDRIADPDFLPTVEDLIMLYIPTVGIIHYMYEINGNNYSIYDVSGRMLERKKWLGFYDGFDAIIFTLAISEFDQTYENESGKHSRLTHAFDLLAETSSDKIFESTPLFIFLNEVDIFKEKLSRLSLKDYFPEYNGSSEKDALSFVKQLAMDRCSSTQQDKITVYFTTAINSKKMSKMLNELFKKIGKS